MTVFQCSRCGTVERCECEVSTTGDVKRNVEKAPECCGKSMVETIDDTDRCSCECLLSDRLHQDFLEIIVNFYALFCFVEFCKIVFSEETHYLM